MFSSFLFHRFCFVVVGSLSSYGVVISLVLVVGFLAVNIGDGAVRLSMRSGLLSPEVGSRLGTAASELAIEHVD